MKGIYSGRQIKALATKKAKITRSQTAAQAVKAIVKKYGSVSDSGKYFHTGKGVWMKYSLANDSRRTGKLAGSKAQWRAQPHKLDYHGIDTKKGAEKKEVKAVKPVGRKGKQQLRSNQKAVVKSVPKKTGVPKSKGHLMFIGDFEIYKHTGDGDVFASRKNNYIDTFGYRADARFIGTKEFWAVPSNRNTVIEGFRPEGYKPKQVTAGKHRYASFQRPLGAWFNP